MEFKTLSGTTKIPVLGLGTWKMGSSLTTNRSRDEDYIKAIKYAISLGITHIDTAEIYGAGHSEELVGEAVKLFDRKKLFITTKVSPHHLSYQGIIKSCENSLKRLNLKFIDLYLIHWHNPFASLKNALAAFDTLVSQGLIRFIGVSNFSVKQFKNAQNYSKNRIVTNQVEYSLLERDPEKELLIYCEKEKIILTAYTPLASGRLTQKGLFPILDKIASKCNKTPAQVALRWLIEKPPVIVIPKASTKAHIDETTGSVGWKLAPQDKEELDQNFK